MQSIVQTELNTDLVRGKLSHAYAVFSADYVALHRIFIQFAQSLVCDTGKGCGLCRQCRLVLEDAHPDVIFKDGSAKFNAEAAAELIASTYQKGTMSVKKLYVIENAEGLSTAVQNKLLKTIEEPPENVTIILGCATEGALLQTVRSRVKKLYLSPFSEPELAEMLIDEDETPETAAKIAASSSGSLSRAIKIAGDSDYLAQFDAVEDVLLTLQKSSQIIEYIYRDVFSKEQLALTLDFMEILLNDALSVKCGLTTNILPDRQADLRSICKGWSEAGLGAAIEKINLARKKLSVNLAAASIAESLLFDILEAKYKWQ